MDAKIKGISYNTVGKQSHNNFQNKQSKDSVLGYGKGIIHVLFFIKANMIMARDTVGLCDEGRHQNEEGERERERRDRNK